MSQETGRRRWLALGWLPGLGLAAQLNAQSGGKRSVRISNPPSLMKPTGYSHLAEITSGKLVYVAGQVAAGKDGQLVGKDDFPAQVRQVFANLNEAVKAAGGSFHDVVKLNYYCADRVDRAQLPAMRSVRDEFVNTQSPPASTLVFVSSLARPEWMIEVEAVAVIGS